MVISDAGGDQKAKRRQAAEDVGRDGPVSADCGTDRRRIVVVGSEELV